MAIDTYHKKTYAPMEPHQLKKLKKGFYVLPIFGIIFGVVLYFLFGEMESDDSFFWVGVFFILFFMGIFGWITWALVMDVQSGEKEIFQGIVTRKKSVRRRSKKGRSSTSYYLYFGKHYERVELHVYNRFQEGDMIEIHRAKRTYNVVFDMKLIKSGVMLEEINRQKAELEEHERKNAWKPIVGFILAIPIILSFMFLIVADCFDCGPTYSSSIDEWKNATEQDLTEYSKEGQQLCLLMNDTLTDAEEAQISEMFDKAQDKDALSELILDLDDYYPQEGSEKSTLQWMKHKYNEEHSARYSLTFFDIWHSTIFAFTGLDLREARSSTKNEYNLSTLNVLNDKSLSYEAVKAWYNHADDQERQYSAKFFLKKDTSELSTGLNAYIKESWSLPMALPQKDSVSYQQGREKYGLAE